MNFIYYSFQSIGINYRKIVFVSKARVDLIKLIFFSYSVYIVHQLAICFNNVLSKLSFDWKTSKQMGAKTRKLTKWKKCSEIPDSNIFVLNLNLGKISKPISSLTLAGVDFIRVTETYHPPRSPTVCGSQVPYWGRSKHEGASLEVWQRIS